uniref:Uncharacterized protein n=1 Tax=Kwoniella bestiolae CBS 10118 TaxID=1296100 RepID=A0A1B9G3W3_9TREE|nr:hypothetical protein I302_05506 [Kwoniella bestiolae CBS 10118]OCF25682.1 hypothetical protein I302_05506 [Kwoniella bestiolae CBS 10118]
MSQRSAAVDGEQDSEADGQDDDNSNGLDTEHDALLTSNIQNPHEALQLLASASNITSRQNNPDDPSPSAPAPRASQANRERKQIWLSWEPVQEELLTAQEAENLLTL